MVRKYSDVLLIFLLKGLRPERYRERVEVKGSLATSMCASCRTRSWPGSQAASTRRALVSVYAREMAANCCPRAPARVRGTEIVTKVVTTPTSASERARAQIQKNCCW